MGFTVGEIPLRNAFPTRIIRRLGRSAQPCLREPVWSQHLKTRPMPREVGRDSSRQWLVAGLRKTFAQLSDAVGVQLLSGDIHLWYLTGHPILIDHG
jgi:hypothetical protein